MAESFLMMPDLFHWLLTGVKANEFTNATHDAVLQSRETPLGHWAARATRHAIAFLGRDRRPGHEARAAARGRWPPKRAWRASTVVLPGTHDTASAVDGGAARGEAERAARLVLYQLGHVVADGRRAARARPHREMPASSTSPTKGASGHRTRLLKNIVGLWLVQECRRIWQRAGKSFSWDDLNRLAAAAPPLVSLVNPDDAAFLAPGDMPAAIREFCRRTGQTVPADEGAVIRTAIESLALRYRQVLAALGRIDRRPRARRFTSSAVARKTASSARPRPMPASAASWPGPSKPRRSAT